MVLKLPFVNSRRINLAQLCYKFHHYIEYLHFCISTTSALGQIFDEKRFRACCSNLDFSQKIHELTRKKNCLRGMRSPLRIACKAISKQPTKVTCLKKFISR